MSLRILRVKHIFSVNLLVLHKIQSQFSIWPSFDGVTRSDIIDTPPSKLNSAFFVQFRWISENWPHKNSVLYVKLEIIF